MTTLYIDDKKRIVKTFVADVLQNRAEKLAADNMEYTMAILDHVSSEEIIATLEALPELTRESLDVYILERTQIEPFFYEGGSLLREVLGDEKYEATTLIEPRKVLVLDDWGSGETIIENVYLKDIEKDWPEMFKVGTKLKTRLEKFRDDHGNLHTKAMTQLKGKRTWENARAGCPELAPYMAEDNTVACATPQQNLADMASCMRVKENC